MSVPLRRLVVGLTVSVTALTGAGIAASPALAALGDNTLVAVDSRAVLVGNTAQPAGVLSLKVANSFAPGDTITITASPSGGTNCSSPAASLGVSKAPTVTALQDTGTPPTVTASLASSQACQATGVKDEIVLTFGSASSGSGGDLGIGVAGIAYDIGADVPLGPVALSAAQSSGAITVAPGTSNAAVRVARLAGNLPPAGVTPGAGVAISPLAITEAKAGALTGDVLITIPTGGATFAPSGAAPVVTVTGDATATVKVSSPVTLTLTVTKPSSTAPATFTINGVRLDAAPDQAGKVRASAGTAADKTAYGANVVLTAVTNVDRFAGQDRYTTAATAFQAQYACVNGQGGTDDAVLTRGDDFPDALAGSYLAGSLGTGILTTSPKVLPSAVLTSLRLAAVRSVTILGGTAAVSSDIESRLRSTVVYGCDGKVVMNAGKPVTLTVTRIAGSDRFDTASRAAAAPGAPAVGTLTLSTEAAQRTAVLARGDAFADALAAGPISYRGTAAANGNGKGFPLLLTPSDRLGPAAQQAISSLAIKQVVIVGGTAAVSPAVEQALRAGGVAVLRLAGENRQATALEIAGFAVTPAPTQGAAGGLGFDTTAVALATGADFPDALTGGPIAGAEQVPLLLTTSQTDLGDSAAAYLAIVALAEDVPGATAASTFTDLFVLGGTGAVSAAAVQDALDVLTLDLTAAERETAGSGGGTGGSGGGVGGGMGGMPPRAIVGLGGMAPRAIVGRLVRS